VTRAIPCRSGISGLANAQQRLAGGLARRERRAGGRADAQAPRAHRTAVRPATKDAGGLAHRGRRRNARSPAPHFQEFKIQKTGVSSAGHLIGRNKSGAGR